MPDENGELLEPIKEETLDGSKFSVELKFEKCKHKMKFINSGEIRCTKCGVGYIDNPVNIARLYKYLKK